MDAAGQRVAILDRRRERGKGQLGIDPPAQRVAHDAPRPRIHDGGQIDEAAEDRDIRLDRQPGAGSGHRRVGHPHARCREACSGARARSRSIRGRSGRSGSSTGSRNLGA